MKLRLLWLGDELVLWELMYEIAIREITAVRGRISSSGLCNHVSEGAVRGAEGASAGAGRVMNIPRYLLPSGWCVACVCDQKSPRYDDVVIVRNTGIGFGNDDHIVRVLLTVVRFDAEVRVVGSIRYTWEIADMVKETLLEDVAEYDPSRFPPGISSMDWGIASCCRDGVLAGNS